MATFTAAAAQSAVPPKSLRVGLNAVNAYWAAPSTYSSTIGTTLNMVRIPKGATVNFLQYGTSQNGDHTFSVGDSVNNARYKADATCTAGLGMVVSGVVQTTPYTYSADDVISIYISLVSESSLGGSWYLNVIYSMDSTY